MIYLVNYFHNTYNTIHNIFYFFNKKKMSSNDTTNNNTDFNPLAQWERNILLIGSEKFKKLQNSCVAVIGGFKDYLIIFL